MSEKSLVDIFYSMCSSAINERGVYPHNAIVRFKDEKMLVMALDVDVYQALDKLLKEKKKGAKELICAFDRFCKDGQGTTLGDCLGGVYWDGKNYKPFIIEYQNNPRIVKEICWDNEVWNALLQGEVDYLSEE